MLLRNYTGQGVMGKVVGRSISGERNGEKMLKNEYKNGNLLL